MSRRRGPFRQANPWRAIATAVCGGLTLGTAFVGFLLLPIAEPGRASLWTKICSAFGSAVPERAQSIPSPVYASSLAWTYREIVSVARGDTKHGEFVASACATCHGERGINKTSWIPNLAGMRAEVTVKQLTDFKTGHRKWPVMNAIGAALSADDIRDVAAYYASLKPAATVAALESRRAANPTVDPSVLRLVFEGDPRRAIAPCASCHGLNGLKLAAPVLAGEQAPYVERELASFQLGYRANDEGEQMRVIAARLTPAEMKALASYLSIPTPQPGDK